MLFQVTQDKMCSPSETQDQITATFEEWNDLGGQLNRTPWILARERSCL
jgi:hypothetical protein